MMEITVKQRLVEYLKYKKIGQNRFERLAGLSIGYINKLRREPSVTKIRCILNAAPDLNEKWLLTGEGNMLLDSDVRLVLEEKKPPKSFTTNSHGVRFYEQSDGLLMEVPLVPYNALGSPDDEFAELLANRDNMELRLFHVDKVYHGNYLSFIVDGDSMDNGSRRSFQRGDTVLVRELDRDDWLPKLRISKWPYWVVAWGNCVRLKQIVAQDAEAGTVTLHSLNPSPEYTDFTIRLDDIHRLFNVVQHVPQTNEYN